MLPGAMSISSLTLQNILSFGPEPHTVELRPLNLLIGANGSGKSNIVDILGLVAALPVDLPAVVREGGGMAEWVWKGAAAAPIEAEVTVTVESFPNNFRHTLALRAGWQSRVEVVRERIDVHDYQAWSMAYQRGAPTGDATITPAPRSDQSVLGSARAPPLDELRGCYGGILIHRGFATDRASPLRMPQPSDLPDDTLLPNGTNLGVVLSGMQLKPQVWDALHEAMSRFYPKFLGIKTVVQGGTVQLFVRESGLDRLIPASRLSEGTLRYLALLAVLLNAAHGSVLVIEEPEQGLHPDVIEDLAGHLRAAAARAQLVVTTHSEHLVSALSDEPEAVLVVDRIETGTHIKRLNAANLASWLERYRLGELWMKGEIGGTRW